MAQAQQESFEPLARFALIDHGPIPRPHQVSHRFVLLVGNVNRRQLARPEQASQLPGITPVGLDPVTGLGGNERGGDDLAVIPSFFQVPVNDVTAGSSFIDKPQFQIRLGQLFDQLIQGVERAADFAVELSFRIALRRGGRNN